MNASDSRLAKEGGGREFADSLDRLAGVWRTPASASRDLWAVLLILGICAATAYLGAVHTRIFGHDIFVVLDGGWRILNGQRPQVDFSPGIGSLALVLVAGGLKLAHNSVHGIGYASALLGGVAGLWGYALGRRRMGWIPAILAAMALALIGVAPYPLGWSPNMLSHAMSYNRYGYALLGLVMLEAFQRRAPDDRASELARGISTGVVSVALFFLKPSYGLVALGFAGSSVLLMRRERRRTIGMALGLVVAAAAMMAFLRFDFAAVWNDLQLLAAARSTSLFWEFRWAVVKGLPEFLALALLALFVGVIRRSREALLPSLEPLAIALLGLLGGALLLATNAQKDGYPLNAVLAILLVEQGHAAAKEYGAGAAAGFLRPDTVILLLGLVCFAPTFSASASGLGYALRESRKNPSATEVVRFQAPHLSELLLYEVPEGTVADQRSNGRVYVTYVNDGMDLIRKVSGPEETIYTLDLTNPFPYALLRPPAHGGSTCMGVNHQFNDEHKPSPAWLFGSADIVMVPKRPSSDEMNTKALLRKYLASVKAGYRLCAESDWWELYKRPSNLAGCLIHR